MEILGTAWEFWWHLLLNILVAINSVVHFPVLSIILFTLLIKLVTVPLTLKSLRSSRNMQAIQPMIKEVQKKYGKDRQKQQEETMKIYQQYGINPASGCFPMLVTLPIFFGLYSALRFTIDHGADAHAMQSVLYLADWVKFANFDQPFLWIPSLAKPDPLFILPVLSGIFQFIQSRMAMPLRDPNNPLDPQTKMMNNMMQFMPLYIIFISANFPAGTVIYWAFSNVFSAVQQYFITGWGSLPNVPGLSFLPRKPFTPPPLPPMAPATPDNGPSSGGAPQRKGVMGWMMDKAMEAQEAQKAAATQQNGITPAASRANETERVKKKGSVQQPPRTVSTSTVKYASDLKHRGSAHVSENGHAGNGNGNGATDGATEEAAPTSVQLPRKKRNKR